MAVILGSGIYTLEPGVDVQVVAAATGTGTTKSATFCIPERPTGGDRTLVLQVANMTATVITVDLQRSADGGSTFQPVTGATGLNVFTGPVKVTNCGPGLYRVNVASFTGTTSDVNANIN